MSLYRTCQECGNQYERRKGGNYDEFYISKYCSKKCRQESGRARHNCDICGTEFIIPKCQKGKVVLCSKECRKIKKSNNVKEQYVTGKRVCTFKIENNPKIKNIGTRSSDGHGYILIKRDELKGFDNWRQEHVHVMEQYIGRKIDSQKEAVHHINGIKTDNRLENLFLTSQKNHRKLHQSVFMELIKDLLDKGLIYFDFKKGKYLIKE